ncbi:MAG: hypothetical protein IKD78_12245, partial [Bacteroidales bacterium]|nr:hypothetical protein [Bacteroidales bacterium]
YVGTQYYKVVDDTQTLVTSYCIHLPDSMVKGVYLEWVKTNFFNSATHWVAPAKGNEAKCTELSDIVTHLTGKKPKQVEKHLEWEYKGLIIKLYGDARLVIY